MWGVSSGLAVPGVVCSTLQLRVRIKPGLSVTNNLMSLGADEHFVAYCDYMFCLHMPGCACMCTHVCVCVYIAMFAPVCVCVYVCMRVCGSSLQSS